MTRHIRFIATIALAIGSSASLMLAQGAAQTPQTQPPSQQPPPAGAGRGDAGQRGAGQAGQAGRQGGGRRGGFTQFTRELAPQDVLVRGKSLYEANCASCHAADLRGGPQGTNLLRSGIALTDQHGENVLPVIRDGRQGAVGTMPAFRLAEADILAIAEYIHSVMGQAGRQGRPPGSETSLCVPAVPIVSPSARLQCSLKAS